MMAIGGQPRLTHGLDGFSFQQTQPGRGNYSGSAWHETCAGIPYSHLDSAARGRVQDGSSDLNVFTPLQVNDSDHSQSGRMFPEASGNEWSTDFSPVPTESAEISRLPYQKSHGGHSQRTSESATSDCHSRRMRFYSTASQGSAYSMPSTSPLLSSACTASSALCSPTQQMNLGASDLAYSTTPSMCTAHSVRDGPINGNSISLTPFNVLSTSAQKPSSTLVLDTKTSMSSSMWNTNLFVESQGSLPGRDDGWSIQPQLLTPTTSSPLEFPSTLAAQSSSHMFQTNPDMADLTAYASSRDRNARKPVGPRPSKVASDLANSQRQRVPGPEALDESVRFFGRSSFDVDNNARDHALYHNVVPSTVDGLYHCPWEGQASCLHKAEKLKCNYDKFVDSHLKPYRCKIPACGSLHFSSTACLLRHEREAHAMHGHGDKPFLCTYENCERGVQGNGFPRHWNLCDHMKRVHNHTGTSRSNASNTPPPPSGRGKKRKNEATGSTPLENLDAKKVATPAALANVQESGLVCHYHQSEQRLQEIVKQLNDPMSAENLALLRNASDCLRTMAQINQRIHHAPGSKTTPSPSPVSSHALHEI